MLSFDLQTFLIGVADKSDKEVRQDIYAFITRIEEFLLMGTLDFCVDRKLVIQALRISRQPLVQEVLSKDSSKSFCENQCRLLANLETTLR